MRVLLFVYPFYAFDLRGGNGDGNSVGLDVAVFEEDPTVYELDGEVRVFDERVFALAFDVDDKVGRHGHPIRKN
jgi:hypothetical protein